MRPSINSSVFPEQPDKGNVEAQERGSERANATQQNRGGNFMRQLSTGLIFAAAFFALSGGGAVAQHDGTIVGFEASAAQKSGTPPRASTTGTSSRSATAGTRGANQRGFCPPGQKKKPGKGSAF